MRGFENVRVWLNSTALAVFSDRRVGVLRDGHYFIVRPEVLLVAAGAREKSLVFKGNTLPGVYGAGAFQTLVNRDLVRPTVAPLHRRRRQRRPHRRLPRAAGRHRGGRACARRCPSAAATRSTRTSWCAWACRSTPRTRSSAPTAPRTCESVTIAKIDKAWKPIPGTEQTFACDTVLVAVGLDPVDEFVYKAKEFGLPVFAAGDSEEIAEASAAMFTGRIRGLRDRRALGRDVGEVPPEWHRTAEILKSRPGATVTEDIPENPSGVFPVFHCSQEIPCNPCTSVCPQHAIRIEGDDIMGLPEFVGDSVRRLREVRRHLPGPRRDAGRLPEGPGQSDRHDPVRVHGEVDQGRATP